VEFLKIERKSLKQLFKTWQIFDPCCKNTILFYLDFEYKNKSSPFRIKFCSELLTNLKRKPILYILKVDTLESKYPNIKYRKDNMTSNSLIDTFSLGIKLAL